MAYEGDKDDLAREGEEDDDLDVCPICRRSGESCTCGEAEEDFDEDGEDLLEDDEEICQGCGEPLSQCDCEIPDVEEE